VGSALGVSREEIPADERFYAGGGGSVRGIPYQLAGPLDEDDDPLGGRSLLEVGAEIRYNFTESLGAVLFLDGGTVYSSAYPDFSEELLWGAGPGLRYYTPIGPLRLDVGVPLQPREGVDDLFQLYISIGQAF
jgi:translocation and assembly module TamA